MLLGQRLTTMRQIISYGDIASDVAPTLCQHSSNSAQNRGKGSTYTNSQERPTSSTNASSSHPQHKNSIRRQKPDEQWENRELTHEEIWDDSSLIQAWDAAMEEYEVSALSKNFIAAK